MHPQSSKASICPNCDDYSLSSLFTRHERPRSNRAAALSALGVALLLAACQAETAPAPTLQRPVQVQRVQFTVASPAREFVGVVRARHETDLAFRVGGKVIARIVNVGDHVRAGEVIARLDPQDLRLQLESAEAELSAATSSLAQVAADLERYTTLMERGFAAAAQFDLKKAAHAEAESRVARARRALELARNQLDYTELKAHADGVITATVAEPGQVVAAGQPVARLAHRGEKEAVVALPETSLREVREAEATVDLWSDRGRSFRARLRELSPQADPATRTYTARFTIFDADEAVAFGMTATVTLAPAVDRRVARLPLSAVLNRGNGPAVFVVGEGGALELRAVTLTAFDADSALVASGVRDGEAVVTLGVQKLEVGQRVRVVETYP
jgi:RND family efflux transporter MFP subunit